jgi:hypothetical protein
MTNRSERFLLLSCRLTGFSSFSLRATGMLEAYMRALDERLPPGLLDGMLASSNDDAMLDDPRFGPVGRNLIVLWYSGAWAPLPDAWTAAYGATDKGLQGVISAAAYQAGLQWVVAGAHPAGAQQQGFGAWSRRPGATQPNAVEPRQALPGATSSAPSQPSAASPLPASSSPVPPAPASPNPVST